MIIKVTKEHIARGIPNNYRSCPIAIALNESSGYYGCGVGTDKLWFGPQSEGEYYQTEAIKNWRTKFDKGMNVYSFEFNTEDLKKCY